MVECLLPPLSTLLNHCSWFFSTQPSIISIGVNHSHGEKQNSEFKRKKQDKAPGEELSEVETGKLRVQGNDYKDSQRTWEKNG